MLCKFPYPSVLSASHAPPPTYRGPKRKRWPKGVGSPELFPPCLSSLGNNQGSADASVAVAGAGDRALFRSQTAGLPLPLVRNGHYRLPCRLPRQRRRRCSRQGSVTVKRFANSRMPALALWPGSQVALGKGPFLPAPSPRL